MTYFNAEPWPQTRPITHSADQNCRDLDPDTTIHWQTTVRASSGIQWWPAQCVRIAPLAHVRHCQVAHSRLRDRRPGITRERLKKIDGNESLSHGLSVPLGGDCHWASLFSWRGIIPHPLGRDSGVILNSAIYITLAARAYGGDTGRR